jgi:DNA-directed RNA polymerase specialized sigma24 family protein
VRDQHCQKRGGGAVLGESALVRAGRHKEEEAGLAQIVGEEPTPAFAAQVAEECQRLLDCLASDELRSIALFKLEGNTTEQIAAKLECAPSTIDRKLQRIRKAWARERPAGA